jgi:hypothetical protein
MILFQNDTFSIAFWEMSTKLKATQKQLEVLEKGPKTRRTNRKKIKAMSEEEHESYKAKLHEAYG